MAFCSNCGAKLKEGVKFCSECGSHVEDLKSSNEEKRKIVYEGTIHKCTNCGEVLPSFAIKCPSCGYEIRDKKISKVIEEFSKKLSECDNTKKLIQLIRTFPIPNTKEDLFEFLVLAKTNMKMYDENGDGIISESEEELFNAWLIKVEQCIEKAKLLITETKDLELYEKAKEELTVIKNKLKVTKQNINNKKISEDLRDEFKKSKKVIITIIIGIVFYLFLAIESFSFDEKLAGLVAIIAIGLQISAFLIGYQIIKIRIRKIYILPIILSFSLFLLYLNIEDFKELHKNYETIEWNEIELRDYIPNLNKKGNIEENSEIYLRIEFKGISKSNHNKFLNDAKNMGYTNVKYASSGYYKAYNEEEYFLYVIWSDFDETMNVYLDAPIKMSTIEWNSIYLKDKIPLIMSTKGAIEENTQTELNIIFDDISFDDYLTFINDIKNMNYVVDAEESENSKEYVYEAYNTDGTKVSISYNECINNINIILKEPEVYDVFVWPTSKLVITLPVPKSNIGEITWNSETHFCIIVANTTFAEFQEYVNECISKGYDENFNWWDDNCYYSADKGDYDLKVKYLGNNVIEIELYYWG